MKLSIIIPVYNLEKYISDTMNSILEIQFGYDYEVIIVNDGSTDNSEKIINTYLNQHNNIRMINIENKGVSNARNIGLGVAEGDYISFVDGDDTVEPDFFQIAVDELDSGSYDFVQGNFNTNNNNVISHIQFSSSDQVIDDRTLMMELFLGAEKKIHNAVWGKVFRATSIRGILFDTKIYIAEDQKYVFEVLQKAVKIKLLSTIGYNYYIRCASAMNSFSIDKHYDAIRVLRYIRASITIEQVILYINMKIIMILFEIYDKATLVDQECDNIYKEIIHCNLGDNRFVSKKIRAKSILLKVCRRAYNLFLKVFSYLKI